MFTIMFIFTSLLFNILHVMFDWFLVELMLIMNILLALLSSILIMNISYNISKMQYVATAADI